MEDKVIIFIVVTVLVMVLVLALALPPILKQKNTMTNTPKGEKENKGNVKRNKLRQ